LRLAKCCTLYSQNRTLQTATYIMTPERYQQISEIYHAAQQVEPERRSDFLVQVCEGDEALLREVTKLLAGNEYASNFLNTPAFVVAAEALAGEESQSFIGKRLGRFKILSLLGAGGMGEVYLAEDAQLGRRVALKLLPPEFTSHTDRLRRFEREARAASALNHPNIITIHDIGETEGIHFIATEYIEGEMLRRRIARGRVPLGEAVEIALQVANALDIAHSAGIIHRDIKPENIMRRPDGYVKVLDFGLAKLTEPKKAPLPATSQMDTPPLSAETSAGMIIGTANYMSPEQARGLTVDRRSDLWSLGVTLYEMVAGKSPFTGQTMTDILVSIIDRQPQPLTQVIPDVPVELERIVMKALAKNCNQRYQSARDMAIDLKSLKRQLDSSPAFASSQNQSVDHPGGKDDRRRPQGVQSREQGVEHLTLEKAIYKTEGLPEARTVLMKKPGVSPAQIVIAALLVVLVGLVLWLAFRPQPAAPVSTTAATSTPVQNVPPAPERQISYTLMRQKMKVGEDGELILGKDNKPQTDGKPYEALEGETFASTDRFSFKFSSPQEGYVYLLNEEIQEGKDKLYTLLFPSSKEDSAKISDKPSVETLRYRFEASKPVEDLLLIWAARPVEVLEAVKNRIDPKAFDAIRDPKEVDAVKKLLEQYNQSTTKAVPDEAAKQISVQGSGDVLIHLIRLKHK
jgi:serine/threonine protein kinase